MKRWIQTFIILVITTLISCGKKEVDTSDALEKREIINALNIGDADQAKDLSLRGQSLHPTDPEFTYYLAQSYSQKAKIDIYTLFPLVKMKIFDLAISEWQQAKEYDKRQQDSINLVILGNQTEEGSLGTKAMLNLRLKKIENLTTNDFELKKGDIISQYSYESTSYDSQTGQEIAKKFYSFQFILSSNQEDLKGLTMKANAYITLNADEPLDEYYADYNIDNYYQIYLSYVKKEIKKRIGKIEENTRIQKYIKVLYSIFNSIPILRTIPIINQENISFLLYGISTLKRVLTQVPKGNRLYKNSLRQLGLLGGYLIAYTIKDSINLEDIQEPIDLICKMNPKKLVNHYSYFLTGIKTTLNVTIQTDFYKKNKSNIDNAKEELMLFPDTITDEQKTKSIQKIITFQTDHC